MEFLKWEKKNWLKLLAYNSIAKIGYLPKLLFMCTCKLIFPISKRCHALPEDLAYKNHCWNLIRLAELPYIIGRYGIA